MGDRRGNMGSACQRGWQNSYLFLFLQMLIFGLSWGGMKSSTSANSVQKGLLFGGIIYFKSCSYISTFGNLLPHLFTTESSIPSSRRSSTQSSVQSTKCNECDYEFSEQRKPKKHLWRNHVVKRISTDSEDFKFIHLLSIRH